MKICLFNDTHFGARNDSLHFSDYFEKFYNEIWFPYLLKNNITNETQKERTKIRGKITKRKK